MNTLSCGNTCVRHAVMGCVLFNLITNLNEEQRIILIRATTEMERADLTEGIQEHIVSRT